MQDRHHFLYPRKSYKTPHQRRLRNTPQFITWIEREAHDELHAKIKPIEIPSHELICMCLNIINNPTSGTLDNVLNGLTLTRVNGASKMFDFLYAQRSIINEYGKK